MKKCFSFAFVNIVSAICFLLVLSGCKSKTSKALFEVRDHTQTGLDFNNELTSTPAFNVFKYMYFYNGAGIGAGDFNNDGFIDLFFASNQHQSKLFLHEGKGNNGAVELKYRDVTTKAQIPNDGGWSTGVSVVDINNDGLLDIYICRVGKFETLNSKNLLLICQGINNNGVPTYKDEAAQYGLDFSGFSTHAAFLDYDMDGDLDMFLMNHSVHQTGNFAPRNKFTGTYHPLSGDRLFRNEGKNKFSDVTVASTINSSAISYGLGLAVSDINLDGWPDMYIGNDFHENDYLYINQKNGTYKDESSERLMHTSQYSMGVDVADINNDAFPEIISLDMLPADPYILKRSIAEDEYNTSKMKIGYGYSHQYTRNNLQFNRGNGMFSEIGLYAGVYATDWSWAPLWMDFDNDGLKDLFISNGIPKKLNDIDYVNYVSDDKIQKKILSNTMGEKEMRLIDKFPEIKLPNKFFKNVGNAKFKDEAAFVDGDVPTYSNGSVYADLDNDGDLDIVVNNINDPILVYENKSNDKRDKKFMKVTLKGSKENVNAIGAKILVHKDGGKMLYEKFPARGFLSSMETPLLIGLDKVKVDSVLLIWPDNSYQSIDWRDSLPTISYQVGLPLYQYSRLTEETRNSSVKMEDITQEVNLLHKHEENPFVEFDRESLIPFMVSRDGPALAVGDANGDGLDDVFIGSSKRKKPALFIQSSSGTFNKSHQPALDNDSTYEDVDAAWVDVNHDGKNDLIIASGGNEYFGTDSMLQPRAYINDGRGNFSKLSNAFNNVFLTASSIAPHDFNGDGFIDLFIGARAVPYEYGMIPKSYLLQNDGRGYFKDVTAMYGQEIAGLGLVKSALWFDVDKDGDKDLILAMEWNGLVAFINQKGTFTKKVLSTNHGWWNFILPVEVATGKTAFIAGNLGENNRLNASAETPVKLYYGDFDDNGKKEQVLTYFLNNKQIPYANRDELQKQIPVIKKKFLYAEQFAKAPLENIFTPDKLKKADVLTADYFANSVLLSDGKMNFTTKPLPWLAQLSPYKDGVSFNVNGDKLNDVLLFGNFYENNIQMGRNDADFGTLLVNKGNGNFDVETIKGLQIKGEVRHVKNIVIKGRDAFVVVRNNDSAMVISVADRAGVTSRYGIRN